VPGVVYPMEEYVVPSTVRCESYVDTKTEHDVVELGFRQGADGGYHQQGSRRIVPKVLAWKHRGHSTAQHRRCVRERQSRISATLLQLATTGES